MKFSGSRLAFASSVIGRVEVLVAKMASGRQVRFGLAGGLGLDARILEDRLDDEVAAGERCVVRGGGDAGEHVVAFLRRGLPALDAFVEQAGGMGVALVGGLLVAVDQHHLDAGHGGDIGDARAHHAGADHAELCARSGRGRPGRTAPFSSACLLRKSERIIASEEGFISTEVNQRASIFSAVSKGTSAPS